MKPDRASALHPTTRTARLGDSSVARASAPDGTEFEVVRWRSSIAEQALYCFIVDPNGSGRRSPAPARADHRGQPTRTRRPV